MGIKNAKEEYFESDGTINTALDYAYYRHLAGKTYAHIFNNVPVNR